MDVVFDHQGIGSCQIEKIVIPGFCALQLVFRVLGLSLERNKEDRVPLMWDIKCFPNVLQKCITTCDFIIQHYTICQYMQHWVQCRNGLIVALTTFSGVICSKSGFQYQFKIVLMNAFADVLE